MHNSPERVALRDKVSSLASTPLTGNLSRSPDQGAVLAADLLIDERVPSMIDARIDEAMSSPSVVAAALLRLSPEDREQIGVLLDALAHRGL